MYTTILFLAVIGFCLYRVYVGTGRYKAVFYGLVALLLVILLSSR